MVPTLVVRWLADAPIASSACSLRFVAVTFFVLLAALMIEPVSLSRLTFIAVRLPTVISVDAVSLRLLLVAVTAASPAIVSTPPSASTLIVPAVPVVTSTPVAVLLPTSTLPAAFSVMWPVPLTMSLLMVRSPLFTSIRILPSPFALTALPDTPAVPVLAVPSLSVTLPPATSTMLPFVPATRSDWLASIMVTVPAVALNSVTVTLTVSTVILSVSVM